IRTIISKELNVDISLKDFLANNTIEMLSSLIKKGYKSAKIEYPELVVDKKNMYEPFPLTEVQMAYLMGRENHFEMGGVSTHGYSEMETKLDIEKLNEALLKVINYQPMLRTIVLSSGEQIVLENVPKYEIKVIDISNVEKEEQDEFIKLEREKTSHNMFKTDQWPLFEFKAFKIDNDKHYLFTSFDMLITDGASIQIIGNLLIKFYNDINWNPADKQCTYRDYILALKEFKKGDVYVRDKEYWLNKVADFPSAPMLTLKENPAKIKTPHFKRFEERFTKNDWQKLKNKASEKNVTASALLAAAYAEVLAFWSNQNHFALNLTVFNRMPFHKEINDIVGDFTSVILLEINFEGNKSFWERAQAIQVKLMEALEHRHYDGIEFIREIAKYNDYGTKSVMPVVFTSVILGNKTSDEPGWNEIGEVKMSSGQTSQVYLDHQAFEENGCLELVWDYVDEIFDVDVIDSMFSNYVELFKKLIQKESPINCIDIPNKDKIFIENYNNSEEDFSVDIIQNLFKEQVKRVPNASAVEMNDKKISYKELDERSNEV
ncbi:non-ribosomal peptide synthetase, partial [Clostridium gasigenes]|uniref:condensation domain-containing protein n=1 Tax=Clostridium gasigenes TaxID=94869 RepID=UPI001848E092